jgi:RNA polymerase sigma-70 factor (ECF subfamily)
VDELDEVTRLAVAARDGDVAAAAELVRATQRDVWRLCAYLCGREAADDLTQDTYLRAWTALPRYDVRSSARTWLLSIARRVAADHVRALQRERRRDQRAASRPGAVAPPDEEVALAHLLDQLDARRRTAFVLTQLVGLSYEEAAEVCRCPVGTIRSRVARARGELLLHLGADSS